MIQDIAPLTFHNQYRRRLPGPHDQVLIYQGESVAVLRGGNGELRLPSRGDLGNAADEDFRYLFDISGIGYFLYLEKMPRAYRNSVESVRKLRQEKNKDICYAVATGFQLYVWYRDNRYCGRCGKRTEHSPDMRMLKCPHCGNEIYPKIAPAVIVGVKDGNRLLLTRYAGRAYKRYALVAGFNEIGETPEETVQREVMEEVGLKVRNICYYKSQPWGVDSDLLLGYFCDLDGSDQIRLDHDELETGEWFEREEIPVEDDGISLTRAMIRAFKEGEIK